MRNKNSSYQDHSFNKKNSEVQNIFSWQLNYCYNYFPVLKNHLNTLDLLMSVYFKSIKQSFFLKQLIIKKYYCTLHEQKNRDYKIQL